MADIWKLDGFEHGSAASGVSGVYDTVTGSPAIVTSPARSGLRALEISPAGAAERVNYNAPASLTTGWQSVYVRFATLPTTLCYLAIFGNANGNGYLQFEGATSGRFAISNNNVGRTAVGPTVVTNTWYLIDLYYDSSGATVSIRAQVDVGAPVTVSRTQASSPITSFNLGTTLTDTYTAYFDDWVMGLDLADYPYGGHHIESLIPTADGTHNITTSGDFDSFTGTAFNNSTTNGNTFIGHRPLQIANTADQVIRQELGTTANYMEFTFENLSAGVAEAVRSYVAAQESAAGQSNGEIHLMLSDNTAVLTEGSLQALDASDNPLSTEVDVFERMTVAPSGGWDNTKVNGLKARVGFGDNSPDVNFVDLMVEVALTDATYATPSKVSAVAAIATPVIGLGSSAVPDSIQATAQVPTPSVLMTSRPTPAKVSGIAAVPTPTVLAGTFTNVFPAKVSAVAAVRTPTITTGAPSADHYSDGYGQGYETITEVVVVPPTIPPRPAATPNLRLRVDFEHDLNPADGRMPEPVWTDISAMMKSPEGAFFKRGRQRELDRNEAGQMTVTVADMDRLLDADNFASPYFPGVTPDRRVRLEAVTPWESGAFTMALSQVGGDDLVGGGDTFHYLPIFDGVIDSFEYAYPGPGRYSVVTLRCSDLLALMSRDQVGWFSGSSTYVEDGIHLALNYRSYTGRADDVIAGQNTGSDLRDIPEPDTSVTKDGEPSIVGSMLSIVEELATTGGGNFFIARDGKPTYRNAEWLERPAAEGRRWAVDAERFHDVAFKVDETLIYNDVTVTNHDATATSQVTDPASQARHPGRPPLTVTTLLGDSLEIQARAELLLANYHEATKVVTMLDLSNVVDDWEMVLSLELWDRITLEVVLPNGDVVTQDSLVEGIELTTSNHLDWRPVLWVSVPPFRNLLDDENASFESGSVGAWTAEDNSVVTSEFEKVTLKHFRKGQSTVPGVRPIEPPRGTYALRVMPVAAGDFTAISDYIPVLARQNYLARSSDQVALGSLTVNYNLGASQIAHLEIDWYDSTLAYLSTDVGEDYTVWVSGVTSPSNFHPAWTRLEIQNRAPSGAAFARLRIAATGVLEQGQYLDDVLFTRAV